MRFAHWRAINARMINSPTNSSRESGRASRAESTACSQCNRLSTSGWAELQSFGQVIGRDVICAVKIGDRARDGADAIVPARAEAEARDRRLNQPRPGAIERAVPRQERRRQLGVRADAAGVIAVALPVTRTDDAFAHAGGGLAGGFRREDIRRQRRDLY